LKEYRSYILPPRVLFTIIHSIIYGGLSMKHYKTKKFTSEAANIELADEILMKTLEAFLKLEREQQQKFSLGAGLYKLRLATKEGRGKSAGSRSILAFKKDNGIFWLHLFSKNEKGNVTIGELKKLKQLSTILLELPDNEIAKLICLGELYEVSENV
jgi:hypothetical protein